MIVYDQIITFLDLHKIITNYQFVFRKTLLTEQAIFELTDNLKQSIDTKEIMCEIFLDFSKTFDNVDHQILLDKLYQYGIRGKLHICFTNYLNNRTKYVKIVNLNDIIETLNLAFRKATHLDQYCSFSILMIVSIYHEN